MYVSILYAYIFRINQIIILFNIINYIFILDIFLIFDQRKIKNRIKKTKANNSCDINKIYTYLYNSIIVYCLIRPSIFLLNTNILSNYLKY